MTPNVIEEMRDRIKGWLDEEWTAHFVADPKYLWGIAAERPSLKGVKIAVSQRQEDADSIFIETRVMISDDLDQALLVKLSKRERVVLAWQLQARLNQMNLWFSGIGESIAVFQLLQRIYYDGINKQTFFDSVNRVLAGMRVVFASVNEKLGSPVSEPGQTYLH